MNATKHILLLLLTLTVYVAASGQSLTSAKRYYDNGDYLEAAKQLRPLADGGDAEAQLMAAQMFFDGLGVTKNEAQGVKYMTMSADQGHVPAIEKLMNYYANKDDPKTYSLAVNYAGKYPELKKGVVGIVMVKCLFEGRMGAEQDSTAAWKLIEGNENFDELMSDRDFAKQYFEYKSREAKKESIDELAEYLFETPGKYSLWTRINTYLKEEYDTHEKMLSKAEGGSVWAMNSLASYYYSKNETEKALEWATKAADKNSMRGRNMVERINFVPFTCNNISIGSQSDKRTSIESVKVDFDEITINFVFRNNGYSAWIAIATDMCLVSSAGVKYRMLSSTLPVLPKTRQVSFSDVVHYSVTFLSPSKLDAFSISEQGKITMADIKLLDMPTASAVSTTSSSTSAKPAIDPENTGYCYFAEKKHLRTMGFIGGDDTFLFTAYEKIKGFTSENHKFDKRKPAELQIYSKRAKLLTPHPAGSYQFVEGSYKKYLILKITNPEQFWSKSDVALIMYL